MAAVEPARCVLAHHTDPERPRRAVDGAYVCAGHHARLRGLLAALAPLWVVLGEPAVGTGGGPRVSGTPTDRAPMSAGLIELRAAIRQKLASWVLMIAEERGLGTPTDTVPAIVAWLLGHHDWTVGQPWVDDYAQDVTDLHAAAWSHAYPRRRTRVDIGGCPQPDDVGARCPGRIVAMVGATEELLPAVVACTVCASAWAPRQWAALGRSLAPEREQWLTAVQLAALLDVTVRTVQRWAERDGWPRLGGYPPAYAASAALRSVTGAVAAR